MACWPLSRCTTADASAQSPAWRTPQWPTQPTPVWTYSKLCGSDNDGQNVTPKHRSLQPNASILIERRSARPDSNIPVRNPGISVLPENIPRLFPQTPGNGRPRSFVDPNPVVGETLVSAIPTPQWQPINPWVGNSWVGQSTTGSGPTVLATPLHAPGTILSSVVGLPATAVATPVAITPATLPHGTRLSAVPSVVWTPAPAFIHPSTPLINSPVIPSTPQRLPAPQADHNVRVTASESSNGDISVHFHVNGQDSRPSSSSSSDSSSDSSSSSPVFPPVIPPTPASPRTPASALASSRPLPATLSAGTTVQGILLDAGGVCVPAGQPTWQPHPCPDPSVNPAAFWSPHPFSVPRQWAVPTTPQSLMRLTGGVPLPGTAPAWVSPAWPVQIASPMITTMSLHLNPTLAPNPNDARIPHLMWDVTDHPEYARRVTGRNCVVPLKNRFKEEAVFPSSNVLHIYVDHHLATAAFWGPIIVKSKKNITVYDVLITIFEYFQTQLRREEYDYLVGLDPENITRMSDSFEQRCILSRNNLPLFEREQGIRRIDTFGDIKTWWGIWVTHKPDGSSYLNLGLRDTKRVVGSF